MHNFSIKVLPVTMMKYYVVNLFLKNKVIYIVHGAEEK